MRIRKQPVIVGLSCLVLLASCERFTQQANMGFAEQADEVIKGTKEACQYLPTVSSVLALLSVVSTGTTGVVTAVCTEVNKLPSRETGGLVSDVDVVVEGVTVQGTLLNE